MYELINEQIEVFVSFTAKGPEPICFSWKNRDYNVDSINFVHKSRQGNVMLTNFAITSGDENYKITYNPNSMEWILEEIYTLPDFDKASLLNDRQKTKQKYRNYF